MKMTGQHKPFIHPPAETISVITKSMDAQEQNCTEVFKADVTQNADQNICAFHQSIVPIEDLIYGILQIGQALKELTVSMQQFLLFIRSAKIDHYSFLLGKVIVPPSARVWRSLRGINNVADGAQGFENYHALHSCRSALT
jgi:hypothetical protein